MVTRCFLRIDSCFTVPAVLRRRRTFSARVTFCAAVLSAVAVVGGADELSSVRRHTESMCRLIHSVEFSCRIDGSPHVVDYVFVGSGDKFRVEKRLGEYRHPRLGKKGPADFLTAYNGDRYQILRKDFLIKSRVSPLSGPYGCRHPMIESFFWAFPLTAKMTLSQLKDPAQWEARFQDARYVKRVQHGTFSCEVLEFPQHDVNPACDFRVFFAREIGYYPVKWERFRKDDGRVTSTAEVVRYKTIDCDGEEAIVPLEAKYFCNGADGVSHPIDWVARVDEASLKVNHEVDDSLFSLFTLAESQGKRIIDADFEFAALEAKKKREAAGKMPSAARRWLVPISLSVPIVVAVYLWIRRRHDLGR